MSRQTLTQGARAGDAAQNRFPTRRVELHFDAARRGMRDWDMATAEELMRLIDDQVAHIWMVRTFLKHSDEAADDQELASVHRDLYDFMLALGPSLDAGDAAGYLKIAKKKWTILRKACQLFSEIQPDVSGHMNFRMAASSLKLAVDQVGQYLETPCPT